MQVMGVAKGVGAAGVPSPLEPKRQPWREHPGSTNAFGHSPKLLHLLW